MPRPTTYAEPDSNRLARAGAQSLNRIEDDVAAENRYANELARQAGREARADSREERMVRSAELDDEVKRWEFEKKKTLDENAKRMKIETDKQAIEANKELFQINTADDTAPEKLADWGAKYFRVLDENTGDPRLIKQFQINQGRAESRQLLKVKADELRLAREAKEAEALAKTAELKANAEATRKEVEAGKLVLSGATVGDDGKLRTNYTAPAQKDSFEAFNKDLEAAVTAYGGAGSPPIDGEGGTPDNVPPQVWKAFEDRKKALVTTTALAASPPVLTMKEEFDALPSKAFYVRDGKRFQKP